MKAFQKIIFISETDTSRGPLAAAITGRLLLGTDISVESRGLVVLFPEPVNQKTVAVAASRGITLKDYAACQLEEDDFGDDVLALVLDEKYKKRIYEDYSSATNVFTIMEFLGGSGDISDPYGGELSDYGRLYNSLEEIGIRLSKIIMEDLGK